MPEVYEWLGARPGDIVYRHPDDRIQWGSQIIVKQNQAAVLFKEGKAFDVLMPGRHFITTKNLPLITKFLSRIVGFDRSPFNAEVIFVSLSDFKGKFGGRSQTMDLAPLQFHGEYYWEVTDPSNFVMEIVGNQTIYNTAAALEYLRGFFVQQSITNLSHFKLIEVMKELNKVSEECEKSIYEDLTRWGIKLIDLKYLGVDTTPEYRDRLFWMQSGVTADKVITLKTVEKSSEHLGKSPGAGFGAGMVLMPELMRQAEKAKQSSDPVQKAVIQCPHCGFDTSPASKFCPNCGKQMGVKSKRAAQFCPNCGDKIDEGEKFCNACGNKLF
ncbi:MAG: zinc-ribbon domain-containing protein [Promethearchaeota archaeon]|nr:MAG: zinc-ribbon domain-containing protein [Candidatus Lokiarchaeota archaeon]